MIFSITFVTIGLLATVFICKAINGSFEIKSMDLADKEKKLNEELQDLRKNRKELSQRLENLKTLLKAGIQSEAESKPAEDPTDLKGWLLQKQILTEAQYLSAEIYGIEKNIDIIGALLTLNMISIEVYEEVKKLKLI
ncbi:hypothetical protein [Desulfovibrio sp. JC010]|uniref:hypothetical protein n=1 Tax=Desulfovibrio sp. JC010 TaxID=2593641 RepID=UPI0013D0188D|nr:hypothetical protein [Desulfovibrio sp. JC010]NDV28208.1 hypothetical protein [Desulfovibrio sp. JC010]